MKLSYVLMWPRTTLLTTTNQLGGSIYLSCQKDPCQSVCVTVCSPRHQRLLPGLWCGTEKAFSSKISTQFSMSRATAKAKDIWCVFNEELKAFRQQRHELYNTVSWFSLHLNIKTQSQLFPKGSTNSCNQKKGLQVEAFDCNSKASSSKGYKCENAVRQWNPWVLNMLKN